MTTIFAVRTAASSSTPRSCALPMTSGRSSLTSAATSAAFSSTMTTERPAAVTISATRRPRFVHPITTTCPEERCASARQVSSGLYFRVTFVTTTDAMTPKTTTSVND